MLYIVATPIGNLSDITLRALDALRKVDIILCEDTRVTRNLLNHYEITDKKLISFHQHTGERKINELVNLIKNNKVALVTDAGTPGISDPGGLLIKALRDGSIEANIIPIPGPSAVITGLSISGFPTDEFIFRGFIPHKNKRQKFLREVLAEKKTVAFYESCHRIMKCLKELVELEKELGAGKQLCVCRELTKKFESIYRGTAEEVMEQLENDETKGEFVVILH